MGISNLLNHQHAGHGIAMVESVSDRGSRRLARWLSGTGGEARLDLARHGRLSADDHQGLHRARR